MREPPRRKIAADLVGVPAAKMEVQHHAFTKPDMEVRGALNVLLCKNNEMDA